MNIEYYLDELLKLLNEQRKDQPNRRQVINVDDFLRDRPGIARHEEFMDLVDILLKDKNARLVPDGYYLSKIDEYKACLITLQGVRLLEAGGYQGALSREKEREGLRTRLVERQNRQGAWIARLTWIIAAGTSIAAIYYGIEILKYWRVIHP